MQTPFSPLSFGKSLSGIFVANGKKQKKIKKTSVKHIRIRLIDGCVKHGNYMKVKLVPVGKSRR